MLFSVAERLGDIIVQELNIKIVVGLLPDLENGVRSWQHFLVNGKIRRRGTADLLLCCTFAVCCTCTSSQSGSESSKLGA